MGASQSDATTTGSAQDTATTLFENTSSYNENLRTVSQDDPENSKNLKFLIGNIDKLPASAKKLFSLGKLYLTTGSTDPNDGPSGFVDLFEPFHKNDASEEDASNVTNEKEGLGSRQNPSMNALFTPLRKSAPLYHAQTFVQWKAVQDMTSFYSLCLPKKRTIYIQPLGQFPDFVTSSRFSFGHASINLSFFETLQGFAQVFFSGLEVILLPAVNMDGTRFQVRERIHDVTKAKQICVNDLYPMLQCFLPPNGLCILGVTWTDLYPENFNFVLGEASVRHSSAVTSFGRFATKNFEPENHRDIEGIDGAVLWKLIKSSSHELCHLLGMEHCTFFKCAMNESNSVPEALSQPLFLCPVCLRKLQQNCGFDVLERYQLLQRFIKHLVSQTENTKELEGSLTWLDRCTQYLNS